MVVLDLWLLRHCLQYLPLPRQPISAGSCITGQLFHNVEGPADCGNDLDGTFGGGFGFLETNYQLAFFGYADSFLFC